MLGARNPSGKSCVICAPCGERSVWGQAEDSRRHVTAPLGRWCSRSAPDAAPRGQRWRTRCAVRNRFSVGGRYLARVNRSLRRTSAALLATVVVAPVLLTQGRLRRGVRAGRQQRHRRRLLAAGRQRRHRRRVVPHQEPLRPRHPAPGGPHGPGADRDRRPRQLQPRLPAADDEGDRRRRAAPALATRQARAADHPRRRRWPRGPRTGSSSTYAGNPDEQEVRRRAQLAGQRPRGRGDEPAAHGAVVVPGQRPPQRQGDLRRLHHRRPRPRGHRQRHPGEQEEDPAHRHLALARRGPDGHLPGVLRRRRLRGRARHHPRDPVGQRRLTAAGRPHARRARCAPCAPARPSCTASPRTSGPTRSR